MTNFEKLYNEYKPQIEKLNKQFKKLQKHTQDLSYTDLKLHDVAFYVDDSKKSLNIFEDFCQFHYDIFLEWLDENYLTTKYIGRTSSFYFHGQNIYDFDIYDMKEDENIFDTLGYGLESELETLFNSDDFYQAYYNLENDCRIDLSDNYDLEDLEIEFDNAIYELEEYLQAYCKEVKAVKRAYKWLENYKANQIENFKEYVANNEF